MGFHLQKADNKTVEFENPLIYVGKVLTVRIFQNHEVFNDEERRAVLKSFGNVDDEAEDFALLHRLKFFQTQQSY